MMKPETGEKQICLNVNGEDHAVTVGINETLLDVLRERLGFTGAKIGCNRGECGACTVLMDDDPVLSCLMLAVESVNRKIITIEGLADPETGELDVIQQAFTENSGIQCGFCTPGMVLSAKSLLDRNPDPDEDEIKEAIQSNLCRCTGYTQIVESIRAAGEKMREV
jgi:carbon-monoxide dehydrogenase small subunit